MQLVGYLYEDYHDARSLEHKVKLLSFVILGCAATRACSDISEARDA
jgi:hypothetical protein